MSGRACVVLNPAAGRGRAARLEGAVRAAFDAVGIRDVRRTTAPGDEALVARRAVEEGCTTVVAVGGDGTWSNVANALLDLGAGTTCRLALVAAGTGNDFAKTAGAPARDLAATARLVADGVDALVDVGHTEDRHFLNIAGFGFDIAVLEDSARISWLHGDALYVYSALRQLFGYHGFEVDVQARPGAGTRRRHLMLIIANARNFGGAFRIAPDASLVDGRLDAIAIGDASPLRRLRLFVAATRGTHVRLPEVRVEQAPSFTLRFPAPPAYELDGEYRRAATAELTVSCVPRALRVVTVAEQLAAGADSGAGAEGAAA